MTFIRYFASIDTTPYGTIALAHLDALREICTPTATPIRLIAASFADMTANTKATQAWARHRDLIATPIETEFINIVCTSPDRWAALRSAKMVRANYHSPEYPSGCKKNVLILTDGAHAHPSGYDLILNESQIAAIGIAYGKNESAGDLDILRRKVNVNALREAVGL